MFLCINILFLILHYLVECSEIINGDISNFGPYDVTISEVVVCRGPKPVDVASFRTNITKVENSFIVFLNITIFADTYLDQTRVNVYSFDHNIKKALWNYRSNSPCKNFIAAGVIQKFFKLSDCFIKKGTYASSLNFTEIIFRTFGPKFFYGTYTARTHLLSKKENIFCCLTSTNIRKL